MTANAAELIGILIACGAAAAALVAPERRIREAGIVVALIAAPLLVAGNVWDEPRVVDLRHSPAQIVGGLVVGTLALAVLVASNTRALVRGSGDEAHGGSWSEGRVRSPPISG